jgi:TusA-related sulfurtransferase
MTLAEIGAGKADEIVVMVDNDAAKENVSRAAASRGWAVAGIDETEGLFRVTIKKGKG